MAKPCAPPDDWDRHWRELADMSVINPAVKYRRRLIRALLKLDSARTVRLLDVGCGEGSFAADLKHRYPHIEVAGVDASETAVAMARARVPGARFCRVDLLAEGDAVPELTGWATHAVCSEVLEHVDQPELLLRRAARWLAPGAAMVLTVPGGPMSALDHHIGHRKHYTGSRLARELTGADFRVERVWRAGFPFHNLYRLLVVLRGRRIVEESTRPVDANSRLTLGVMRLFDGLFRLNLPQTPFGWQIVARARARG